MTAAWDKAGNAYLGGGGTFGTDAVARAVAQSALDALNPPASTALQSGDTVLVGNKLFTTNKATTMPASATEATLAAHADFDVSNTSAQVDEIVVSTVNLTGTPPTGASLGINVTNGLEFYDNAGVWAALPVMSAAQHYQPAARANDTRGVAPTAAEARTTPVSGDTAEIILSDGTVERWNYTTAWGLVSTAEVSTGSSPWTGPHSTDQTVALADFTANRWDGSFGAPATLTVDAGLPDGTVIAVQNTSTGDVIVASSAAETFASDTTATLNGSGAVAFKKSGTNWVLLEAIMALESSLPATVIPPNGGEQFVDGLGRFRNPTGAVINIPANPTVASLEALGAQYIMGLV